MQSGSYADRTTSLRPECFENRRDQCHRTGDSDLQSPRGERARGLANRRQDQWHGRQIRCCRTSVLAILCLLSQRGGRGISSTSSSRGSDKRPIRWHGMASSRGSELPHPSRNPADPRHSINGIDGNFTVIGQYGVHQSHQRRSRRATRGTRRGLARRGARDSRRCVPSGETTKRPIPGRDGALRVGEWLT